MFLNKIVIFTNDFFKWMQHNDDLIEQGWKSNYYEYNDYTLTLYKNAHNDNPTDIAFVIQVQYKNKEIIEIPNYSNKITCDKNITTYDIEQAIKFIKSYPPYKAYCLNNTITSIPTISKFNVRGSYANK